MTVSSPRERDPQATYTCTLDLAFRDDDLQAIFAAQARVEALQNPHKNSFNKHILDNWNLIMAAGRKMKQAHTGAEEAQEQLRKVDINVELRQRRSPYITTIPEPGITPNRHVNEALGWESSTLIVTILPHQL